MLNVWLYKWIVQIIPQKKKKGQSQNLYMNFSQVEERFLKLCEMQKKKKGYQRVLEKFTKIISQINKE